MESSAPWGIAIAQFEQKWINDLLPALESRLLRSLSRMLQTELRGTTPMEQRTVEAEAQLAAKQRAEAEAQQMTRKITEAEAKAAKIEALLSISRSNDSGLQCSQCRAIRRVLESPSPTDRAAGTLLFYHPTSYGQRHAALALADCRPDPHIIAPPTMSIHISDQLISVCVYGHVHRL